MRTTPPVGFQEQVHERGNRQLDRWLADGKPVSGRFWKRRRHWKDFQQQLAEDFEHRCAYTGFLVPNNADIGSFAPPAVDRYKRDHSIDHFEPKGKHPRRAYDWDNLRYASGYADNELKGELEGFLDPLRVQTGWFYVEHPTLMLRRTDDVPAGPVRDAADFSLGNAAAPRLSNHPKIIEMRQRWIERYVAGDVDRAQLAKWAPLIGAYVDWVEARGLAPTTTRTAIAPRGVRLP